MTGGTRRDALDPAERARQAGLPAAARANGWVGSPDPDGVTVAQVLAAHGGTWTWGGSATEPVTCGCGWRGCISDHRTHVAAALVDAGLTTDRHRPAPADASDGDREALADLLVRAGLRWNLAVHFADAVLASDFMAQVKQHAYDAGLRDGRAER